MKEFLKQHENFCRKIICFPQKVLFKIVQALEMRWLWVVVEILTES